MIAAGHALNHQDTNSKSETLNRQFIVKTATLSDSEDAFPINQIGLSASPVRDCPLSAMPTWDTSHKGTAGVTLQSNIFNSRHSRSDLTQSRPHHLALSDSENAFPINQIGLSASPVRDRPLTGDNPM